MPAKTESEVKIPTDLLSPERARLLLPKLTDEQLATLMSYGVTEQTSVGQVLATAAGPAGLAAAVYGATEGLSTAIVDALAAGGQASTTTRIENYLGFPAGISGTEFGERAQLQAQRLGAEMYVPHAAVSLSHHDGYYHVVLEDGAELLGKAVIFATGVSYRGLEVTGIEKFEGVGVFYSPSDADHVEAEDPVVIVGGGNSAGQAATALAASGHPTTTGPPWKEVPIYSRPACQVCSRSATCGPTQSSASRPRWERAAWPFASRSSTLDSWDDEPTQWHRGYGWTERRAVV
jgi:hypothetical protein